MREKRTINLVAVLIVVAALVAWRLLVGWLG
jgi:hypothetical protein